MPQSDYIVITGSRNLNDGSSSADKEPVDEPEDASLRALEGQGISILEITERPGTTEPRDQFSRELLDEAGIEILHDEEEDASL